MGNDDPKEVLEHLLHTKILECAFDQRCLPLLLSGLYGIRCFLIDGKKIYAVQPKEHVALPQLAKHMAQLKRRLQGSCILFDTGYTRYGMRRLVDYGIPFLYTDGNIYLPDMGIRIHESPAAHLPEVERFSPFTQKLVLTALYSGWNHLSGKEISLRMGVSRATANRAFVELEALDLPLVQREGKVNYWNTDLDRKALYNACHAYWCCPVRKTLKLTVLPEDLHIKGGLSALAAYSMLNDDAVPAFAVDQEGYRRLNLPKEAIATRDDQPSCVLQIHRYLIVRDDVIDPVSATLSVPETEQDDPRIEQAKEQIREDVFRGRWS